MAIRGAVHHAARVQPDELDLAATFNMLNVMMTEHRGRQLVASAAMLCDLAAGRLSYINSGAPPPVMVVGAGRLITLDQPSLLLGIDGEYLYEDTVVDLPARFRLIAYTDGVCDAANSSGETFTDRHVHELLLELNQEIQMTLVVVTHNMDLSAFMSRKVTIFDGKLVEAE